MSQPSVATSRFTPVVRHYFAVHGVLLSDDELAKIVKELHLAEDNLNG